MLAPHQSLDDCQRCYFDTVDQMYRALEVKTLPCSVVSRSGTNFSKESCSHQLPGTFPSRMLHNLPRPELLTTISSPPA